jgi:hypothetical protein
MAEPNQLNNYRLPEHAYFNKILIKLMIIIFTLLLFFLATAYLIKNKSQTTDNKSMQERALAASLPLEPDVIYMRGGTITDIRASFITVSSVVRTTSYDPETAYETKTLTLNIDGGTNYYKKDYRTFNDDMAMPTAQASSLGELRRGDYIVFKSNSNIKDSTSFNVREITLIIKN